MSTEQKLNQKTVAYFDERYPGKINELLHFLFAEQSFVNKDYTKYLFESVLSIAGISPTIFVGRGTHLILPRENVLAVRFICSDDFRVARLARIMDMDTKSARQKLTEIDKEQQAFFNKVFSKKDAVPYEFDMVINCDYISNPKDAADIVACAFTRKFPSAAAAIKAARKT